MKDRSRIDIVYAIFLIIIVTLSLYSVTDVEEDYQVLNIVLLILANGFIASIYMFNLYEMKEDELKIRFGVLRETIRYESISELSIVKNYWSSMALARRRIKIRYHYKGGFNTTTYISPMNLEGFFQALKSKSKLK